MKMTTINIHDAKTHLSAYARRIRKGERFILCERNKPFAEIRPLRPRAYFPS
jgi:antitoxin (DNA-binding transcriptional repressor) of toxin-antitoxin stability system